MLLRCKLSIYHNCDRQVSICYNLQVVEEKSQVNSPKMRIQQACLLISLVLLLGFGADGGNSVPRLPGFPGELPFKLETGYVGVGEDQSIQLFYYFVESTKDSMNDPLIIWLSGGPGCSALAGMLYEIGPFQFDYKAYNGHLPPLKQNPYTYAQLANMLFLDAPVGTGFSYSENEADYYTKDDIAAAQVNYLFLQKWLSEHPQFLKNSLYIAGDSYSGKIVPILVHEVLTGQKTGQLPRMNLQGYVLGNPVTDKVSEGSMHIPFMHRLGLISDELYESAKANCGDEYLDVNNVLCLNDQQAIVKCIEAVRVQHVLEPNCKFAPGLEDLDSKTFADANVSIDSIVEALNGRKPWCRLYNHALSYIWANDPTVQDALHVRKGRKNIWKYCNKTVYELYRTEIVSSVLDYHRSFFNSGYRALIYSGDHDMSITYLGTMKWIASFNLTLTDHWRPWIVEYQTAGYTRTYKYEDTYELTFATVKGAGHIAPEYYPKPCLEMLDRWLAHSSL